MADRCAEHYEHALAAQELTWDNMMGANLEVVLHNIDALKTAYDKLPQPVFINWCMRQGAEATVPRVSTTDVKRVMVCIGTFNTVKAGS